MKYTIMSGKYENGTDEQKNKYISFFGEEDIQELFDLYFHWYNVVHEFGHILVAMKGNSFSNVDEEQIVNDFTIAYLKEIDIQDNIGRIKKVVHDILKTLPRPIPENQNYLDYFRENWGEFEMTVPMYGFFQMSCVESSLKSDNNLISILEEIGFYNLNLPHFQRKQYAITSETAKEVIRDCKRNISLLGIEFPSIEILLVDNPDIQCCRCEEQ